MDNICDSEFPLELGRGLYISRFGPSHLYQYWHKRCYAIHRGGALVGAALSCDRHGWRFTPDEYAQLTANDMILIARFIKRLNSNEDEMQRDLPLALGKGLCVDKSDGSRLYQEWGRHCYDVRRGGCLIGVVVPCGRRGWWFNPEAYGELAADDMLLIAEFIERLRGEKAQMQSREKQA